MTQSYRERFLTRTRSLDYLRDLTIGPRKVAETLYITPDPGEIPGWEWLPQSASLSENGLVLIEGLRTKTALSAPFAIKIDDSDRVQDGPNFDPFITSLKQRRTIAFILLRLGQYAVGVADDEKIVASKTGTRYVKGRHRAGGQSQRRFERNREVWIARLYGQLCKTATERFAPYERALDALALGGDKHVLEDFQKRCDFAQRLSRRVQNIHVPVDRPGMKSLERAVTNAWGCRVWEVDIP
jgi:hypothetical protein